MAEIIMPQADADFLLQMEKVAADDQRRIFPDFGGNLEVPLISRNQRETFSLDISRKRIALTTKYQVRGRQVVVLARLDFGAPHRNPDDSEIGVPHLHLYREGFGDKWAYPVPVGMLCDLGNAWQCLLDFMRYCNVVEEPKIIRGLFA
ncbi:DUF6978 family protein [Desulfurivibrio dismutans]|uniref:DUF6978 family protein n=1 Tax=Desulfurivibrio dismutans TaxID=1398908 RepID=UPI0023DAEC0F|nr:hypothetical protein [Desulfurivibrio alkaliphilus]MDF1614826.1 hypothetical protein [Desulfurivibrio alkaliphilus]